MSVIKLRKESFSRLLKKSCFAILFQQPINLQGLVAIPKAHRYASFLHHAYFILFLLRNLEKWVITTKTANILSRRESPAHPSPAPVSVMWTGKSTTCMFPCGKSN